MTLVATQEAACPIRPTEGQGWRQVCPAGGICKDLLPCRFRGRAGRLGLPRLLSGPHGAPQRSYYRGAQTAAHFPPPVLHGKSQIERQAGLRESPAVQGRQALNAPQNCMVLVGSHLPPPAVFMCQGPQQPHCSRLVPLLATLSTKPPALLRKHDVLPAGQRGCKDLRSPSLRLGVQPSVSPESGLWGA